MIVTLRPRNPSVNIGKVSLQIIKNENFFVQLEKEVRGNPKQAKILCSAISTTITMLVSNFIISQPVMAATTVGKVDVDPDLRMMLWIIIGLVAFLAIAAFLIGYMSSGVWKMFFGGKQADQWRDNIIKGFIQVISAPIILTLILGLFHLLFGKIPAFQIIEEAARAWFQEA